MKTVNVKPILKECTAETFAGDAISYNNIHFQHSLDTNEPNCHLNYINASRI